MIPVSYAEPSMDAYGQQRTKMAGTALQGAARSLTEIRITAARAVQNVTAWILRSALQKKNGARSGLITKRASAINGFRAVQGATSAVFCGEHHRRRGLAVLNLLRELLDAEPAFLDADGYRYFARAVAASNHNLIPAQIVLECNLAAVASPLDSTRIVRECERKLRLLDRDRRIASCAFALGVHSDAAMEMRMVSIARIGEQCADFASGDMPTLSEVALGGPSAAGLPRDALRACSEIIVVVGLDSDPECLHWTIVASQRIERRHDTRHARWVIWLTDPHACLDNAAAEVRMLTLIERVAALADAIYLLPLLVSVRADRLPTSVADRRKGALAALVGNITARGFERVAPGFYRMPSRFSSRTPTPFLRQLAQLDGDHDVLGLGPGTASDFDDVRFFNCRRASDYAATSDGDRFAIEAASATPRRARILTACLARLAAGEALDPAMLVSHGRWDDAGSRDALHSIVNKLVAHDALTRSVDGRVFVATRNDAGFGAVIRAFRAPSPVQPAANVRLVYSR